MKRLIARLRQEEKGWSLIELLIVSSLLVVVLSSVVIFTQTAERSQIRTVQRTDALRQQSLGLERMTRELREAVSIVFVNSEQIKADTFVRTAANTAKERRWVFFDCKVGNECRRCVLASQNGACTGINAALITGVESFAVFTPTDGESTPEFYDPQYVELSLRVRLPGVANPITLTDGVNLRNASEQ